MSFLYVDKNETWPRICVSVCLLFTQAAFMQLVFRGAAMWGFRCDHCISFNRSMAIHATTCQDSALWSHTTSDPAITINVFFKHMNGFSNDKRKGDYGWEVERSSSNQKGGSSIPVFPICMLKWPWAPHRKKCASNWCTVWMCVWMG